MEGAADHFLVVSDQRGKTKRGLKNARSISEVVFKAGQGGEEHCQIGAILQMQAELFRWIDAKFRAKPELAEANKVGVNEARRSLRRDGKLDSLKETLLEEKVWELLMERVQIKDAAPVPLWVSRDDAEAEEGEAL